MPRPLPTMMADPPPPPRTPEPPARLLALMEALPHPPGWQLGLTTAPDGRWALLVRVPPGTHTPVDAIERALGGEPTVYRELPADYPVARPAFPDRGE